MSEGSDTTPGITRSVLVMVLTITASAVGMLMSGLFEPAKPTHTASLLWLFTGLFVLRVAGQVLVALRPQHWLPPMHQWNFIPYHILLPIQIVFIVVMIWINLAFTTNVGIATIKDIDIGNFLVAFSAIYATAMVIRYTLRMLRFPDQRWFGGTIPIVFHFVLASYLYTLGYFYAST